MTVRGLRTVLHWAMSVAVLTGGSAWAQWHEIAIPGAVCGLGAPYSVFIRPGDPKRLTIEFMGGGACWNGSSCFGTEPKTDLSRARAPAELGGILSRQRQMSPVAADTVLFFPYCTGDVFLNDHTAQYVSSNGVSREVHHRGKRNVILALEYLGRANRIDRSQVRRLVVYGYSAGALGAMGHAQRLGDWVPDATEKVLLADAPGLHFGDDFWNRFSSESRNDYRSSLAELGYSLRLDQGLMADVVPFLCGKLLGWQVGVLQGASDWVMSRVFGGISPSEHERRVLGAGGLAQLTLTHPDCRSWIPRSPVHTFLVSDATSAVSHEGVTAREFAFETVQGGRSE